MVKLAPCYGIELLVTHRDPALGYGAAVRKTAKAIRQFKADLCMELHFNSAGKTARGCEILYFWGSRKSKHAARCVSKALAPLMDELNIPMRGGYGGARSLWYRSSNKGKAYSGRGGYYAWATPCPALILEPFFGSNKHEMTEMAREQNMDELAQRYLLGALEFKRSV
jgi:N-acetylmuramoyl-L-alanine amidase